MQDSYRVLPMGAESPLSPMRHLYHEPFTGEKTESLVAELVPGRAARAAQAPGTDRSPWGGNGFHGDDWDPQAGVSVKAGGSQGCSVSHEVLLHLGPPRTPGDLKQLGAPWLRSGWNRGGFLINWLIGLLPTLEVRIIAIFNGVDLAATIL